MPSKKWLQHCCASAAPLLPQQLMHPLTLTPSLPRSHTTYQQTLLSKPADSFNVLKWKQEDIITYIKTDALKPGLPVVVLLAIWLLTLVVFLFWCERALLWNCRRVTGL